MKPIHRSFLISAALIAGSLVVYSFWWRTNEVVFVGNLLQASALAFCGMKFNQIAFNSLNKKRLWRGWAGVAAGLWFWFLAQLLESYSEMILYTGSYGTIADCFWGLGSTFYLTGTIILLTEFWPKHERFRLTAGATISLSAIIAYYIAVFVLVILPHLVDPSRGFLLKILDFLYPTYDVSTAFCFCLLIFLARLRKDENLALGATLVSSAFLLYSVCDLTWGYFRNVNSFIYRLQDIMFFVGYCINAIAAIPLDTRQSVATREMV